ncbi:MAG TPA: heme-copper oxidase subunit III [Terriglobales bacterium]|nr:heme-copper oxidase subunit III [Terriglobales bacterium]
MASLGPTVTVSVPEAGHGGGSTPPHYGGDGGGPGDGYPDYGRRLRRARLGLAVALAPILMFFVSLVSAAIVRRGLPTFDGTTNTYMHDWIPVDLPFALLLFNTGLLAASSLSAEFARRQITRQAALAPVRSIPGVSLGRETGVPWLYLTVLLGAGFLAGQWRAWQELAARGFYLATNASSSFVYLLTAAHAVHLAGGAVVLLYAAVVSLFHKPIEARRIVVDVTAWYWHFIFLLWVAILALLWLLR